MSIFIFGQIKTKKHRLDSWLEILAHLADRDMHATSIWNKKRSISSWLIVARDEKEAIGEASTKISGRSSKCIEILMSGRSSKCVEILMCGFLLDHIIDRLA